MVERVEEGDELLTRPGPPPSLSEQLDREEKSEALARSLGDDPGSPEARETRALRREVQRLRAEIGQW
ncbi:MAG: hypothetical protein H0V57_03515 [Thermoleophilaceae bacterium]|nr:hypothetical protein [Thermoleophilaceae bacterium]